MRTLSLAAVRLDISVSRRDTASWEMVIADDDDVPIDITGFSFLLSVDPSEDPSSSGTRLFQLTGTITDAENGVVQFAMNSTQANQEPATYYYDLQQTDGSGKTRTLAAGKWKVEPTITGTS